jgi:hypothetical protein
VDQTLSALKAMSWTASFPFKGHFCLETDIFNASLETDYDLFWSTTSISYRGYKHIIWFNPSLYPITGGFGKDSGGQSLIADLLQAAKSVGNCSLVSNCSGFCLPTIVPDLVQFEQCILKCSNFRLYLFEEIGMSSTLNEGTGTNSYRVTTYTRDKTNACGCNSSSLALKQHNSTLCHTSCTCCAKFTIRMDHNSCLLVSGFGENQHTGHPPLLSNKMRNCKRFLYLSTLETVASSPPKLLCSPKPVPVRSLLVVRWHMCKDLQKWQKS